MLTLQEKKHWAQMHLRSLSAFIDVEFCDKPQSKTPYLEFGDDEDTYTDHYKIHIGLAGFEAENEVDLFNRVYFLISHELQHVVSTTMFDWAAAIDLGLRDACLYIAQKVLGRPVRLVKDADYEAFSKDLESRGYHLNKMRLTSYIHFVLNALEDGRIEALRAKLHGGFQKYRRIFRTRDFLENTIKNTGHSGLDVTTMDAVTELQIVTNQILNLSTIGLYQEGFEDEYANTRIATRLQGMIPAISRGVIAPTCRMCMEQGRIILSQMYDLLLEASKMSEFEQLLTELVKQLSKSTYTASAADEETGDGMPGESAFKTDKNHPIQLEIEMTEEEFEEFKKKVKPAGDDESGIQVIVKIKDKKPEPKDDEHAQSGNNGTTRESTQGNQPSGQNNGPGTPADEQQTSQEDNAQGTENGEKAQEQSGGQASSGQTSSDDKPGQESQGGKSSEKARGTNKPSGSAGNSGEQGPDTEGASQENVPWKDQETDNDAEVGSESTTFKKDGRPEEPSSQSNPCGKNGKPKPDLGQEANEAPGTASAETEAQDEDDFLAKLKADQEKAAQKPTAEQKLCEDDIKRQKTFSGEMSKFKGKPVMPMSTAEIDSEYTYKVNFTEAGRVYTPDEMLPQSLETRGDRLSSGLEKILKRQKQSDRNMASGRLDGGQLVALGAFSDIRVFMRQGKEEKPDAAMFLLGDNSGSMGSGHGSNRFYCWNAFAIVERAVSKFIPVKIVAFDANGNSRVTHEVVKEFDENGPCNFSYNFQVKGRRGRGNKDGYSIRVATKQLLARPEQDKILIIASDGLPSDYSRGFNEGTNDVRKAVQEARKAGIKVIAFYMTNEDTGNIEAEAFAGMYDHDYIVCNLDSLAQELEQLMRKLFKKK